MLHGELAVPCNLQPAPAGWIARQRVLVRVISDEQVAVTLSVLRNRVVVNSVRTGR